MRFLTVREGARLKSEVNSSFAICIKLHKNKMCIYSQILSTETRKAAVTQQRAQLEIQSWLLNTFSMKKEPCSLEKWWVSGVGQKEQTEPGTSFVPKSTEFLKD